jgi:hypothetical protein
MNGDPLDGVFAKLNRAKRQVDALRRDIFETNEGDPKTIGLGRKFESDSQAIVYRIDRVPEVKECWGLLVGEVIHNFRCTLDHLWWQLAILHLRREPTEKEAGEIQFPLFTKEAFRDDPQMFWKHRFLNHVSGDYLTTIERMQPYNTTGTNQVHALRALVELSNIDKHRVVHPVVTIPLEGFLTVVRADGDVVDCVRLLRIDPDTGAQATVRAYPLRDSPQIGDKVFEAFCRPTGPNPDVDLHASLSGYIAIRETWDLMDTLDFIGHQVVEIVGGVTPLFEPAPPI